MRLPWHYRILTLLHSPNPCTFVQSVLSVFHYRITAFSHYFIHPIRVHSFNLCYPCSYLRAGVFHYRITAFSHYFIHPIRVHSFNLCYPCSKKKIHAFVNSY